MLLLAACSSSKKVADRTDYKAREQKNDAALYEKGRNQDPRIEQVIAAARSFTGTPYRWGGTSRSGMDCSGLLMTSFQAADLHLPRTTEDQVKYGYGVRLYELKPGDLVFFAAKKSNPNKVTHVGMVTEIRDKHDVRFIHASTKLGVVENNIYTDYYRKIFIKARRPF
jgi:cell wall-associated NlpC family hydrolase